MAGETGVSPAVLNRWRLRGWLTAPGPDFEQRTRTGMGVSFDWIAAFDQIDWLRRLTEGGRIVDDEDAAAGWRLRDLGCPYGIRVATEGTWGTWLPLWALEVLS